MSEPDAGIGNAPDDRPTPMQLVQLLLPVYDNTHQPFPRALFDSVRSELTDQFGGVTAFVRSPAVGVWEDPSGAVCRDEVILFEVMAEALDHAWWRDYRKQLEQRFKQEEIMIRASGIARL
ncbi:MAG: hypothetical protein AVDCRST_MAG71-263 [uncultured Lysobacter sp.]|uniref:DUF1330 domain-containing protein n=1 Tax=uncultured Lysobacter sp. TaxID=271060 RepID=A0A6J4KD68_9GAMM|nr:MAG: hypothetical protein AVDCRST_MAG71-263 [uncultured Lysobacter sp.]